MYCLYQGVSSALWFTKRLNGISVENRRNNGPVLRNNIGSMLTKYEKEIKFQEAMVESMI